MPNNENIWTLIVRYLDSAITTDESARLEEWLDDNTENRRMFHSVNQIWKASEEKSQDSLIKDLNLEKDWDQLAERIQKNDSDEDTSKRVRHFRLLRKRQQLISNIVKAAALVLVAFTSGFLTLQYAPAPEEVAYEPVFNEITTSRGERANVDLGDGSKVQLNADSKLIIPDTFRNDRREVELKGQAFFDVKSDRSRPFYIRSGDAVVEVVGTAFDVRSYEDEGEVRVVVREGTVELKSDVNTDESLVLNEGYMGRLTNNDRLSISKVDDMDFYLGWMNGRLIFKETPLKEVFANIERWYNVSIELDLSDDSLLDKKFTADLKTRSVKEVLEVLSMSMDIKFEVDDDRDIVYITNG